ncbi:MAG: topoisomerase DNA-binding C4 zinc finger domain-containing protein, partial [Phycisphaerae bacterium]|nr:topoisomerase DNA-binding C4 zinc finger domain-containing protein [Phycisphaerae bacterium]
KCEKCGGDMLIKMGKNGHFLGCSGYPECRSTMPCNERGEPLKVVEPEELKRPCEECEDGEMIVKWKGRRAFLGCDAYPKCKATAPIPEGVDVKRPPAPPPEEAGVECDKCKRPMLIRSGKRGKFIACSGYPRCRNTYPIEKHEALRASQPAKQTLAEANGVAGDDEPKMAARKPIGVPKGTKGKVDLAALGDPPPGFAWTRTGRPVVETMPHGDLQCPECGSTMELKRGRFGPFFSCSNFPKCKFNCNLRGEAKKEAEEIIPAPQRPKPIMTDIPCTECGQPMLVRQGPRGRFLGCSGYPKCKETQELPPGFKVPEAENGDAANSEQEVGTNSGK